MVRRQRRGDRFSNASRKTVCQRLGGRSWSAPWNSDEIGNSIREPRKTGGGSGQRIENRSSVAERNRCILSQRLTEFGAISGESDSHHALTDSSAMSTVANSMVPILDHRPPEHFIQDTD